MKSIFILATYVATMTENEMEICQKNLKKSNLEELSEEKFRLIEGVVPIIDEDFQLECQTDICCSSSEVGRMTWQLSSIILDKFNQQAESVRFAAGKIRQIYSELIEEARIEFDQLFSKAYSELYTKNRDVVDEFLTDLENLFISDKTPGDMFDDFFKRLTRRHYLILQGVNYADLSEEDQNCVDKTTSKIYENNKYDVKFGSRQNGPLLSRQELRSTLENSLVPLKRLLWTLDEISIFLGTLNEERLLASARCVSPMRYCGPCSNKKSIFLRNDCENIHRKQSDGSSICFDWLADWEELVQNMHEDMTTNQNIKSNYNIYRIFKEKPGLAENLSNCMSDVITGQFKMKEIVDKKCNIKQQFPRQPNPRLEETTRNLHAKRSTGHSQLLTQFGPQLMQASTKAKDLENAIIRSVCDGLPEVAQNRNLSSSAFQSAKGLPDQSKTLTDQQTNDQLAKQLHEILIKLRPKRQLKSKKQILSDDEDIEIFEASAEEPEMSGDYDQIPYLAPEPMSDKREPETVAEIFPTKTSKMAKSSTKSEIIMTSPKEEEEEEEKENILEEVHPRGPTSGQHAKPSSAADYKSSILLLFFNILVILRN